MTTISDHFCYAIKNKHTEALKKLIAIYGEEMDLNAMRDEQGETLLTLAVKSGELSYVQLLLEAGLDPTIPNSKNIVPLHLVVDVKSKVGIGREDAMSITALLLQKGADPVARNSNNMRLIDLIATNYGWKYEYAIAMKELLDDAVKNKIQKVEDDGDDGIRVEI